MKKLFQYISILILAAAPSLLMAQGGKPYDMMINGVKVIVQPSGNDIVVIQTIIKGGVQNYPAVKAGIENLAMTALTECGTLNNDKNSYKDKLEKVSANVNGNTGMSFANVTLNC